MKRIILGLILATFVVGLTVIPLQAEEIGSEAEIEAKFSIFKATSIVGYSFLSKQAKTWTGGGVNLCEEKLAIGGALENDGKIEELGIFATINVSSYEGMDWYNYVKDNIILFFLPKEVKPYVASDYGVMGLVNWEGELRGGAAIVVNVVKIPLPLPWLKK